MSCVFFLIARCDDWIKGLCKQACRDVMVRYGGGCSGVSFLSDLGPLDCEPHRCFSSFLPFWVGQDHWRMLELGYYPFPSWLGSVK